jgi:hypothetical protein
MTKQATSGEIRRLRQALSYNFGSRKVGVMNVWQEEARTMVAQLAISDPATGKDEKLRVGVDDEFAVGKERYRVVQIVSAQGNDFAYLEVVRSKSVGAAVLGAVIAGICWAVSGVTAVIYPDWDVATPGSAPPYYVIEGTHAVAETAMVPALLWLWNAQRIRLHRPGSFGFGLAVTSIVLLAAITYATVIVPLVGITEGNVVVDVLFLLILLGTVVGFIMCGIATIRARVWPPATGPLLIAHQVLSLAVLASAQLVESYAIFIAVGLLWFVIAWIIATRKASDQTGQPGSVPRRR